MLKGGERKLSKLLLKEVNEISNDANKKFDEKVKVLYPHSFSERKKNMYSRVILNTRKAWRRDVVGNGLNSDTRQ